MRLLTCVLVVVCVARKLRSCPSYSRRRDRINLGLWRSLYKGGGGVSHLFHNGFHVTGEIITVVQHVCNRGRARTRFNINDGRHGA